MDFFQCQQCGALIASEERPSALGCPGEGHQHRWNLLGPVGSRPYECRKCGTTVELARLPSAAGCPTGGEHQWVARPPERREHAPDGEMAPPAVQAPVVVTKPPVPEESPAAVRERIHPVEAVPVTAAPRNGLVEEDRGPARNKQARTVEGEKAEPVVTTGRPKRVREAVPSGPWFPFGGSPGGGSSARAAGGCLAVGCLILAGVTFVAYSHYSGSSRPSTNRPALPTPSARAVIPGVPLEPEGAGGNPAAAPSTPASTPPLKPFFGEGTGTPPPVEPAAPPAPVEPEAPVAPAVPAAMARTAIVSGVPPRDTLTLRSAPGVGSPPLGHLVNGDEVQVTGESVINGDTEWVPVRIGNVQGWLSGAFLVRRGG